MADGSGMGRRDLAVLRPLSGSIVYLRGTRPLPPQWRHLSALT
jgi:hypothetical protein